MSEISPWGVVAAVSLVARGGRARLAIRGVSMEPLLRAPMVVRVAPLRRTARIGEIVVFVHGRRYVVHRVLARSPGCYVTAGDANAESERVPATAILGRVDAVWSDDSPCARRVDRLGYRLRGLWYARGRPIRLAAWVLLRHLRAARARFSPKEDAER